MTSREQDTIIRLAVDLPGVIFCAEPPTGAGFGFGTSVDDGAIVAAVDPFYLAILAEHLDDQAYGLFLDGLVAWTRHVLDTTPAGVLPTETDYGNSRYWLATTHPVLGAAMDNVLDMGGD